MSGALGSRSKGEDAKARGKVVTARRRTRAALGWAWEWHFRDPVVPAPLAGYVAASAGVAVASLAIGVLLAYAHIGSAATLYLLVVLPTAVRFGWGPALFASVASLAVFDWFFVRPLHTFTIADPEEWIALLLFLVVAAVASRLAAAQRQRADEARRREREARALQELGRILHTTGALDDALAAVVTHLRSELGLAGVAVL